MTWFGSFMKAELARWRGSGHPSGPRIDENLPFDIKPGGIIVFRDEMPFIGARTAGLLAVKPDDQEIRAYGRCSFPDQTWHRFYFADGIHFMQVVVDSQGVVVDGEIKLYRLHKEIFPDAEGWKAWRGEKQLHREGLREAGHTEKQVMAAIPLDPEERYLIGFQSFTLADADDDTKPLFDYVRLWPEGGAEQVEPILIEEKFYTDPYAQRAITVKHHMMLYGRAPVRPEGLGEEVVLPTEYCLVQASGYPGKDLVQLHTGIDLDPRHFLVAQPR